MARAGLRGRSGQAAPLAEALGPLEDIRATADVALTGHTEVTDVSGLGLDRFDDQDRSKLAPDPIALPFPGELRAFPGELPAFPGATAVP